MMLRASYHHHYLFPLIKLANSFCFSISFFLGLLQSLAPLFLASPRLSSLLSTSLCSSQSLQASSEHQQGFSPLVPFSCPLHRGGTFSPQAPGGFQGWRRQHDNPALAASFKSNTGLVEHIFGAEGHGGPQHTRSSWGLPPQGVCSCRERHQGVMTPKIDPPKVKAPYVTCLSKDEGTGVTDDSGSCIKGTKMGREKKVGFQT